MQTKVVNKYKERYDIYIGRGSQWGNPFVIGQHGTRAEVIQAYRDWITKGEGKHLLNDLHKLRGKTLGCFCKPQACHGDVLVDLVNQTKSNGENHGT